MKAFWQTGFLSASKQISVPTLKKLKKCFVFWLLVRLVTMYWSTQQAFKFVKDCKDTPKDTPKAAGKASFTIKGYHNSPKYL